MCSDWLMGGSVCGFIDRGSGAPVYFQPMALLLTAIQTRTRARAHSCPLPAALMNELKVQRCFCARAWAIAGHFPFRGHSLGPVFEAYCLICSCSCCVCIGCAHVCARQSKWSSMCDACPSPPFPRFISIYDQLRELCFFWRRRDRSYSPPAWTDRDALNIDVAKNGDVNYNGTFLRKLPVTSSQGHVAC